MHFKDIAYLRCGTKGLIRDLQEYQATLAGTVPPGIDVHDSDLAIIQRAVKPLALAMGI
ncbi:MAG: hypothetical protein M1499_06350 [Firmicutes bacterium]|nr:hypothetical protein [Bacillota bacterium]